jgi:hypothetical protein
MGAPLGAAGSPAEDAGETEEPSLAVETDELLFGCVPLQERWVNACDVGVTASWDGAKPKKKAKECVYNPPPGWVLVEHKIARNSDNNGSYSINTLAKGLQLTTLEDLRANYHTLLESEGNWMAYGGKGRIEEREEAHERLLRQYQTNKNTLVVKVSAKAHGDLLNRKRGWMKLRVKANLLCLGSPAA